MSETPKLVLIIAGFDPSSGAGVTADIKTIAAHGLYGAACITAITVQSTQGVRRVEPLSPVTVTETLEELLADSKPAAVKIGMLGSEAVARAVAGFLRQAQLPNVVLDPIMRSSSGAALLEPGGVEVLKSELLGIADVVTPNLDEATILAGVTVVDHTTMTQACTRLKQLGARNIVIKGGHLAHPNDLLARSLDEGNLVFREYPGEKIHTPNTHGTGCAFATAIACNLAVGINVGDAVLLAKDFTTSALKNAYSIGKGHGPINHFYGVKTRL